MATSRSDQRPSLLVISGLDPSGGAGFIADVRVAEMLAVRAVGVVVALTEQSTTGVRACHPVAAEIIGAQLMALLSDVPVDAVKIGLIPDEGVARAIALALALTTAATVWDPVLQPTAGPVFFRGDIARAVASLAPHVALITPNAKEAAALTGLPVDSRVQARGAAEALVERGFPAALVKGGHLPGHGADADCIDVLAERSASGEISLTELRGARLRLPPEGVHGTGCALSTAIACGLAAGVPLVDACRAAKAFVEAKLAQPVQPGRGVGALV